jgi:hypothetical protein
MKIGKLVSINYSQLKVKISSEIRGGSVNLHGAFTILETSAVI